MELTETVTSSDQTTCLSWWANLVKEPRGFFKPKNVLNAFYWSSSQLELGKSKQHFTVIKQRVWKKLCISLITCQLKEKRGHRYLCKQPWLLCFKFQVPVLFRWISFLDIRAHELLVIMFSPSTACQPKGILPSFLEIAALMNSAC